MTKDEALKLALEAIEFVHDTGDTQTFDMCYAKPALAAIKKALAHPEQEPVGQLLEDAFGRGQVMWFNKPKDESMLYTTPKIEVGCAECGVNGGHALYCVECAEKFVGEATTKLQQKQETIEGLNRDYDLLFAEYQLLLKNTRGQE